MTCFQPLQAYKSFKLKSNGRSNILFSVPRGSALLYKEIKLPCGQCVGCRLERSRQWAIRCVHEAFMYDDNCFITLTYNDKYLPYDGSLQLEDFQNFMKRLRKRFGEGIRYYHCGEYGDLYGRPHYHAVIFNFDFSDKYEWSNRNGFPVFRSMALEELWPFGNSEIGTVTFESAAYCARYVMKKVNGDLAESHYLRIHPVTGEIFTLKPEYNTMSRRPGIGRHWYEKYKLDVYSQDEVIIRDGISTRPPRFYDSQYEVEYPSDFARIKERRELSALKFADNNTPERLKVREQVQLAKLVKLPRNLDKYMDAIYD